MLQCILGTTNQNSFMAPNMHCSMNKLCSELSFSKLNISFATIVEIHELMLEFILFVPSHFLLLFYQDKF